MICLLLLLITLIQIRFTLRQMHSLNDHASICIQILGASHLVGRYAQDRQLLNAVCVSAGCTERSSTSGAIGTYGRHMMWRHVILRHCASFSSSFAAIKIDLRMTRRLNALFRILLVRLIVLYINNIRYKVHNTFLVLIISLRFIQFRWGILLYFVREWSSHKITLLLHFSLYFTINILIYKFIFI